MLRNKDVEKAAPRLRCVARRSKSLIGYCLDLQERTFENSRKWAINQQKIYLMFISNLSQIYNFRCNTIYYQTK